MPPSSCDVAVSLRSHEGGRAGHALKQALQKRGLRVVLCDESPGDEAKAATTRALQSCKMAVMLGTETYGKRVKGGFSTLQQLRYIVDEEMPFFLIKTCDHFLEPEARLRFTTDMPHCPWHSEQDSPDIVVPADLVNEIVARVQQLPEKSQEEEKSPTPTQSGKGEEAFADSTRHLDLADKDKSDTRTTEHTCEQPAPGLLSLADAGFPGETDTDADPSTALERHGAALAPTTSGVGGALCDTPEGGGNSDLVLYDSVSGIDGLEIYGASSPATQLASGSAPSALPNCNRKMSTSSTESVRPIQNLLVFEIDTSGRSNPANQGHGRYKQVCFIILLGLCVVAGIAAAMSIAVFGVASGSGDANGTETPPPSSTSSPPTTTTSTATSSSTSSSLRISICNGSTTETLDCGDPASRSQFADTGLCEAGAVANCCCDEFYDLRRILGSVSVLASLGSLRFGDVLSIGGDVLAPDGALSSVEFGGLTHVGGRVDLSGNNLTSIKLGQLTHVEGDLVLGDNTDLTRISFGTLANVGGSLDLSGNALSSVDFTPLLSVGGRLGLHYNALSGVNFASLTRVGGRLDLHSNVLTDVAFGNLTRVGGDLYVRDNNFTSIDFGQLTHVEGGLHLLDATLTLTNGTVQGDMNFVNKGLLAFGFGALTCVEGGVDLSGNSLRSVEFGSLNKVIGWLSLRNNSITDVDFGSITSIGGRLDLRSNNLTSIDCGGVAAECMFADDGVTYINCPVEC